MWFFIILFIVCIYMIIKTSDYHAEKNKEEKEGLTKTIQNLENECNEINSLINQLEEVNNEKDNKGENLSYYDDTVQEEEIRQTIARTKNDKLTSNEIVFLSFMNNKSTDISFSPRWEFQYELKPRVELAKLLKLEYLTHSSWYDNVKNATMKELKEVLKAENLKTSGNKQELIEKVFENIDADLLKKAFNKGKYILTDKGKQIIEKNKRLFMSDREKAGKEFEELTDAEYSQLQVFHKVSEYKRLKHNELSFEKGYTKNDILWAIYNIQKDVYIRQKDYVMVGVAYDHMCNILDKQERYEQEIQFLICCMYFKVYEMLPSEGIIGDIDYYESRIRKHCKHIKKLMKNCNKDIDDFKIKQNFIINEIDEILQHYISTIFLDFEKVNKFKQKINKFLDT